MAKCIGGIDRPDIAHHTEPHHKKCQYTIQHNQTPIHYHPGHRKELLYEPYEITEHLEIPGCDADSKPINSNHPGNHHQITDKSRADECGCLYRQGMGKIPLILEETFTEICTWKQEQSDNNCKICKNAR